MSRKRLKHDRHDIEDRQRGKEDRFKMVPGPGALVQADGSYIEPQPGGRGGLKRFGVPISKSPPPSALRARMRHYASEQMYHAVDILDSESGEKCEKCLHTPRRATNADILKALDLLLRYGIGAKFEKFSPELVRALALSVQAEVHDEEMLKRIEARWAIVLREHVTGDAA